MTAVSTPDYMTPLDALTGPVEVKVEPSVVTENRESAAPKTSPRFPGRTPYRVGIEIVRGFSTKTMPDGTVLDAPDLAQMNVTVWSLSGAPDVRGGEYVQFTQPMIGAVDGALYVQALDVKPVTSGAAASNSTKAGAGVGADK